MTFFSINIQKFALQIFLLFSTYFYFSKKGLGFNPIEQNLRQAEISVSQFQCLLGQEIIFSVSQIHCLLGQKIDYVDFFMHHFRYINYSFSCPNKTEKSTWAFPNPSTFNFIIRFLLVYDLFLKSLIVLFYSSSFCWL